MKRVRIKPAVPPRVMRKRTEFMCPVPLKKGMRVTDLGYRNRDPGTIIETGPEVSVIQWDNGPRQAVTNNYILPLEYEDGQPEGKSDDSDARSRNAGSRGKQGRVRVHPGRVQRR